MEAQPQDFDVVAQIARPIKLELHGLRMKHVRVARLIVEGELTQNEIAERCGISRRQLVRWLTDPAYEKFQTVLRGYAEQWKVAALVGGLVERWKRIEKLTGRHKRCEGVIDERAADPTMQGVPGGSTGLLVRNLKQIGAGPTAQVVEEYEADIPLLAEMRQIEEQIARECGHRDKAGASVEVNISIGDRIARARERLLAELPETTITVTASDETPSK